MLFLILTFVFFNIISLRMRSIAILIIFSNFCAFIIAIDLYINFSKQMLIESALILTCKIFVKVVL